ncbi:MAG TPA: Hpt domain-containing protein [Acidobacteriaceae bacterium]|jgi:HPt (histidine-containing phosphotransfer) domain-containing protein|nr:Hpt domain-containing protein [Acidobacteriaceae bacterium]
MSNLPPEENSLSGAGNVPERDNSQQKLHQLLAGLWEKSRKTVAAHVETLQQAKELAAKNELDEPARTRAIDAAHKLAGVLGTFGLPRGTELAREAEEAFRQAGPIGPAAAERLNSGLNELDRLIQAAVTYPASAPKSGIPS